MTTNFESAYHFSQLAHPLLKASGQGNTIFISSIAAEVGFNVGSVYSSSNAAMSELTRYLACEWAKDGIRTNAVLPWTILTPLVAATAGHEGGQLMEMMKTRNPLSNVQGSQKRSRPFNMKDQMLIAVSVELVDGPFGILPINGTSASTSLLISSDVDAGYNTSVRKALAALAHVFP
ncbi:Tropinone reductase-like protein [Drosera capensis]